MTLFLSASRLTPAEASNVTATRFDSVLSLPEVDHSPELESPAVHHHVESESSLMNRGFDAGFQAGSDAGYESGYESGLKSGHDAGFAAGLSEGRERMVAEVRAELQTEHTAIMLEHSELRAKLEIAVNTMASALSSLESATVPVYAEVGMKLGDVVVELVEGLLGSELSADKAHVVNAISSAAAEIPGHSEVRVLLHPDDLEIVQDLDIDFEEALQRPVRLMADDSIELHGAVVTSGCTRVDSQIGQRIAQLKEALSS